MNNLSLKQKIGQMMMVGFLESFSGELPESIKELLGEYKVGGVILYSRNGQNPKQVRELTISLQEEAEKANSPAPLFISADQEGGIWMQKISETCTFPGNMALAAGGDRDLTYQVGKAIGIEAQAMGINTVLAPVLDVNVESENPIIGVRAFSDKALIVREFGKSWIRGCEDSGALATAKHFPGHGRTKLDSHLDLPIVDSNLNELVQVDLLPFQTAIEEKVSFIMTTHSAYPSLSEGRVIPATISQEILTGLLREKMGFEGLIITDCLEMKAISEKVGVVKGAVEAVKAGVDVLLISRNFEHQKEIANSLFQAVKTGEIPLFRIEESVERILDLKRRKLKSFEEVKNGYGYSLEVIGSSAHKKIESEASDKAITLLRNEEGIIPLNKNSEEKILLLHPKNISIFSSPEDNEVFLTETGFLARKILIATYPLLLNREDIREVRELAKDIDIIIVATGSQSVEQGRSQGELIRELLKLNKPVIAAGIHKPYDIVYYPEVKTYLVSYGFRKCNVRSLIKVIFGKETPQGRLPVNISELFKRDTILDV